MKERGTKRKVNKIDLYKSESEIEYQINSDTDQLFILQIGDLIDERELKRMITINFGKNDVTSDIEVRVVLEKSVFVDIFLLIKAKAGVKGVSSTMDMKALLIHPESKIRFVPSLEIDELDVSVDHKSSIGSLTQEWLDYLGSRGINKRKAVSLLRNAFLAD